MMPSDVEIWKRINEAVDLELAGLKGIQTSEKEISRWLEEEGIPLVGDGPVAWREWNSLRGLLAPMNLQIDLIREHRRWLRGFRTIKAFPARKLEWGVRQYARPEWLEDRWIRGLEATTFAGAVISPMVAMHSHPIWRELSEVDRPFGPLFPVSQHNVFGEWVKPVGLRAARELGVTATAPHEMLTPVPPAPWPEEGRLDLAEWMGIREAVTSGSLSVIIDNSWIYGLGLE